MAGDKGKQKKIQSVSPKVARTRSNQNPDIEPLGTPGWATGFYRTGQGQILPNGVVFIPDEHGSMYWMTHDVHDAVPPGGKFLLSANGGLYVQLPPDHPYWQEHPEYKAATQAGVDVTGQQANSSAIDQNVANARAQYDQDSRNFQENGNVEQAGGLQPGLTPTDPLGLNKGKAPTAAKQPDGSVKVTAGNGKTDLTNSYYGHTQAANLSANSVFSALALPSQYQQNTTFLFSEGPNGLTPTGTTVERNPMNKNQWIYTTKGDDRQDLQMGPRGMPQNQPMNSAQQQNSKQYMTMGQAVQWFVNQSVTDKDLYNQLVVNLNHAGYFADQTGGNSYVPDSQLPLGTYSKNAGQALVEAMQDLAVAQAAGETSDLNTWLKKRSQGYEDFVHSGAGYNPVDRAYQDPATLAATAKQAAQQALGRNLTPAEEAHFEAAFRGKENAAYNEQDTYGRAKAVANFQGDSGLPAGTPTGYTMPDTGGEADSYMDNPQFAQEKANYSGLELTKGLLEFLKGGSL